jgi:hypothetical protein
MGEFIEVRSQGTVTKFNTKWYALVGNLIISRDDYVKVVAEIK